jgi:acyl-CoA synthetase (AMP-forming)/AMP-acid ligase II
MAELHVSTIDAPRATSHCLNVADRLRIMAAAMPDTIAVACPRRWSPGYPVQQRGQSATLYAATTFASLDADATRIACGLAAWGVPPGTRLALLVRPGIEFVTLVFALLRAGIVIVLIDPGMGRRNLIRCLSEAEPEGFVAISPAQAVRACLRRTFPCARWNVTLGRRWFWGGLTLDQLRNLGSKTEQVGWASPTKSDGNPNAHNSVGRAHPTMPDDPAAIIFTSGSTGPPKGVLYTHRMFDTQVSEIQSMYGIEPGGVDLACFPLFALFNSAMGVTTVLPEMDFSRPATADPRKLLTAANDWQVTQAFASPAVWRVVSDHCAKTGARIRSLRQVFSCGAPVGADVLRGTLACIAEGAQMHTPYGATECLPVSTIESTEVLREIAERTELGAGVCVGRPFPSIDWRVIRIIDDAIASIEDAEELPTGEIGELIVRGPQVSPRYVTRTEANAAAKIREERAGPSSTPMVCRSPHMTGAEDGPARFRKDSAEETTWHRTGDVGYFDDQGRFWYCGRKSQRVETTDGTLYTECVEPVFNRLPAVRRSALVGVGPRGLETPVIIVECEPGPSRNSEQLRLELIRTAQTHAHTSKVRWVLFQDGLPVDVRHNAKINREKLAGWAATRIGAAQATRSVVVSRSHAERGNEV